MVERELTGEINDNSKRCKSSNIKVNLKTCAIDQDRGADELQVLWTDEDYSPDQNAFYYARVIQNPTCRWTTYDSLRTGQQISKAYSSTMVEMAWSSPIWIK